MTTQFTISCGLDCNGYATVDEARQIALDLAAEAFPHGHTIRETTGRWQCTDGNTVTEATLEVVWMADPSIPSSEAWARVARLAAAYKAAAHQEAVMITTTDVDATFV